jgi:hypothetical protein
MKWPSIAIRVVILGIGCMLFFSSGVRMTPDPVPDGGCTFYNDEGEVIPTHAVKLLVKAEFYRLTLNEIDTVQKYFVISRHLCPFIHCPMKDQLRFIGCGDCKKGSDCYAHDMVHWEYPTWSYDQCDSLIAKHM